MRLMRVVVMRADGKTTTVTAQVVIDGGHRRCHRVCVAAARSKGARLISAVEAIMKIMKEIKKDFYRLNYNNYFFVYPSPLYCYCTWYRVCISTG